MAIAIGEQRYQAQTVSALQGIAVSLAHISQCLQNIQMTLLRMEQKQRG